MRTLRLHNASPSLVAYWLDSAHQPLPDVLRPAGDPAVWQPMENLPRLPGNGNGPVGLRLPEGITALKPSDMQHALRATGTSQGLDALEKLLPTLDVPLVQYEVEAQFVEYARADFAKLPLKFPMTLSGVGERFISIAPLPNGILPLITAGARVLSAPRVTAIDGLGAQVSQRLVARVVFDEAAANADRQSSAPATNFGSAPGIAYFSTSMGFAVTPHHSAPGVVTLSLQPTVQDRTVSVVVTVRENSSFALRLNPLQDEKQILVLATVRRINRLGEQPPTQTP